MKKGKSYKLDHFGYAQLLLDIKQEKIDKINNITSLAVLLVLFALGVLSKEFLIIILANKGIGKITSWMIG